MRYGCPKDGCGRILVKARLDIYWCDICKRAYIIRELKSYKTFEEASKTWEQAWKEKKDLVLAPPIGNPIVPDMYKDKIAFPPRVREVRGRVSEEKGDKTE